MGFLQKLRNEVAIKSSYSLLEDIGLQDKHSIFKQEVLPKMQEIFAYMSEIVGHIQYLEYEIEVNDYSNKYPEFGKLTQKNYKINTDGMSGFVDPDKLKQINIIFDCQGIGTFRIQKEGKSEIENLTAFLHEKRINFDVMEIPNHSGKKIASFHIHRKIPIIFKFTADEQQSRINFYSCNHNDFESIRKSYNPNEINEKLLEKIAKYILRQDNDFIKLPISEDHVNQIRQKLKYLEIENKEFLNQTNKKKSKRNNRLKNIITRIIKSN